MHFTVSAARVHARRVVAGFAVLSALALPAAASAQRVDFEALSYAGQCRWGGSDGPFSSYAGFTWTGFRSLTVSNLLDVCDPAFGTGYDRLQAANIGNVIALGSGAASVRSVNPFVLTSFVAGAGWIDVTRLTLSYFLGGVAQATRTLDLRTNETGAQAWQIGNVTRGGLYAGAADEIRFTPDYTQGADVFGSAAQSCIGAIGPCVPQAYQAFFIDNLTFAAVTVVPEPGTMGLVLAGLLAVGASRRRKYRKA